MPCSSYGDIFISKRKQFRSSFPLGIRSPLSKASFVKHIRAALEEAGLPVKDYASRSFRIGAASTAAVAGL